MIQNKILQNLGLSKYETDIYLILLKKGELNISEISKLIGLNRPTIYKLLPSMVESGLIGENIRGKRKYYLASDPEVFNNYFKNIKNDFDFLIPELKETYSKRTIKPILKSLDGKNGIKYILNDIITTLNKGDVFYRYSSRKSLNVRGILPEDYKKIRDEKKLERMVITNDLLYKTKKKRLEKEVVIIPKNYDIFEDDIMKVIYANKVAIVDYNSNQSFIIENEKFATFERKIFKLLFRFLRKR